MDATRLHAHRIGGSRLTPDGRFTYTADYSSGANYDFNGVLLVDDGSGAVPALRDDRDTFDAVHSMTFGPDGLVAWTADDYNYGAQVFVGRIDDTGRIVDTHKVDAWVSVLSGGTFDDDGVLTSPTYGGSVHVLDTRDRSLLRHVR